MLKFVCKMLEKMKREHYAGGGEVNGLSLIHIFHLPQILIILQFLQPLFEEWEIMSVRT